MSSTSRRPIPRATAGHRALVEQLEQRMLLSGDLGMVVTFGGSGQDLAQDVVTDRFGNAYVTGTFTGTVDFNPGPRAATFTSAGGADVFVAKYSPEGSLFWVRRVGGSGEDLAGGVAVDAAGNVLVTGGFTGAVDFMPGKGTAMLSSAGGVDAFVWKLDSAGGFVWAGRGGGSAFDTGTAVTPSGGQVFVAGTFTRRATFTSGNGTFALSGSGGRDSFLWRLTSAGATESVGAIGGSGDDYVTDIAPDASGNLYATGSFSGDGDFNPGSRVRNLPNNGGQDVFVAKYNNRAGLLWAVSAGAAGDDRGTALAVDSDGDVAATGFFSGSADFDPGSASTVLSSAGLMDAFVWKLDGAGGVLFASQFGGSGNDAGFGIAVDSSGNIYTVGSFQRTADFDPGDGSLAITTLGRTDAFVQKLTGSGQFVYARTIGGSGADAGLGISVTPRNTVVVAGAFSGAADFAPGDPTETRTSAGGFDGFVATLTQESPELAAAAKVPQSGLGEGNATAATLDGGTVVVGDFSDTANFAGSGPLVNLTSAGNTDVFIAKYDEDDELIWAAQMGGGGADAAFDVTTDASGNIYLVGGFQQTADFDPGADEFKLTTAGGTDAFIASLDGEGNFRWAKAFGGPGNDTAMGLGLNSAGQMAVTGSFQQTLDFNFTAGGAALTSGGGDDIFIVQAHTTANDLTFDRAQAMGGTGDDSGFAAATDPAGDAYMTGFFSGSGDFDPGASELILNGPATENIVVAKLRGDGTLVYAEHLGGAEGGVGNSIAADAAGNAYVTGWFAGAGDFDASSRQLTLTSAGGHDVFLLRLNSAGRLGWAEAFGSSEDDEGNGLALDPANNVYVTGSYSGTVDFNPGDATANQTSAGDTDIFLAKYTNAGQLVFAQSMGGDGADAGFDVAIGGSGSFISLIGQFSNTADLDPGTGQFLLSAPGSSRDFVARLLI